MTEDWMCHADTATLLARGPAGDRRIWAAELLVRTLETGGEGRYLFDEQQLSGADLTHSALQSLATAAAALTPDEHGLLLRAMLLVPWEMLRRKSGLNIRLPEVLEVLAREAGLVACRAAAKAVIEEGDEALRQLPLEGLLPEVRRKGQGHVLAFDAATRRALGITARRVEIDRLTMAIRTARGSYWQSNLRHLVAWWLEALGPEEATTATEKLAGKLTPLIKEDRERALLLGLLDWAGLHPEHAAAPQMLARGVKVKRGDVRKAAADLARVLERWDVLEALAGQDPDMGVRKRAQKLLEAKGSGATSGQCKARKVSSPAEPSARRNPSPGRSSKARVRDEQPRNRWDSLWDEEDEELDE